VPMAALALKSIQLSTFLAAALALATPALAGDVSVKLDAGTGFSVKDSTGTVERLRVDEATGNISRNGALFVHTTGMNNLFVGPGAGNTSSPNFENSAFGFYALSANTYGAGNSAFGFGALRYNTGGAYNTAVGRNALRSNTTGQLNVAVGMDALGENGGGSWNSAVGVGALRGNNGSFNVAVGHNALRSNTGFQNSAVGVDALLSNTAGTYNSAFGANAMFSNTIGDKNTALGYGALFGNVAGSNNSAVGFLALTDNTGNRSSAFGFYALRSNSTGQDNSAFGSSALFANTTGYSNSALGGYALSANKSGAENAALGRDALGNNKAGSRNIAVGFRAGFNQTTGSDNIYLANTGVAAENTTIRIGCPAGLCPTGATPHNRAFIAGIRGVTTGAADAVTVVIDSAGQLGTVSSSREVKKDIHDMGDATARLLDLRPVTFRYKQEQTLPGGREVPPEYGLIAEEVAQVFPDLVVYDDAGKPFTVKYHEMAPMLLNEMKKQQRTIDAQRQENQTQQAEIASLTSRLARLEAQGVHAH
ncbi:MAG TPA: tail fiber domain-containing protein, partial [Myxococcota bacterium]|nr:tail fiber domain-containing protein [Myxococcota bacterium]